MDRLDGRTAVVTGGSSGIGNAIATAFAREGAAIVVADVRREPKLPETTAIEERLDELGAEHRFVEADVSDERDVERVAETSIDVFGGLDILVNNAGIYRRYKAHETPLDEWEAMLGVNLRGTFLMSRAALPQLRASDAAAVINLSSEAGLVGIEDSAAYCASKGGITNLTRQLAVDYGPDGVRVNAIAPGLTQTAQNKAFREEHPEEIARLRDETPLPRFGEPGDVAKAAVFLASDESAFITGQILSVDGGITAR